MDQGMQIQLFKNQKIRTIFDPKNNDYFYSVVDVVRVLTESENPRRYWRDLKNKLINEGSQLYDKIVQLKMQASDGKYYLTDVLNTEGVFRLIQSIPSKKAVPKIQGLLLNFQLFDFSDQLLNFCQQLILFFFFIVC